MMSDRIMQSTMSIAPLATQARRQRRPTAAEAIRHFCLDCLGASSGRAAFDCGSTICPLRPASPFLGKAMPEGFRAPTHSPEPRLVSKRRPSRRLIEAQCRQCQPEDRDDCEAVDCGLHPYRPWPGPGHAQRRKVSLAQATALARAREKAAQKTSRAAGAALDA